MKTALRSCPIALAMLAACSVASASPLLSSAGDPYVDFDITELRSWSGLDLTVCTQGMRVNGTYTNSASGSNTSYFTSLSTTGRATVDGCSLVSFQTGTTFSVAELASYRGDTNEIKLFNGKGAGVTISSGTAPGASATHWIEYVGEVTLNRDVQRLILVAMPENEEALCKHVLGCGADAPDNGSDPLSTASASVLVERMQGSTPTTAMFVEVTSDASYGGDTSDADFLPTTFQTNSTLLTAGTYRITLRYEGTANRRDASAGAALASGGSYVRLRFEECPADYNGDQVVDFFDYLDFNADFSNEDCLADFNFDGTVDFFDYLDFTEAFDNGCD